MAIKLTTEATLEFVALQIWINETESKAKVRLTSLIGKTESDVPFNAHVYESVGDNSLPLSKLFVISAGQVTPVEPPGTRFRSQGLRVG